MTSTPLLDTISSPEALKEMAIPQLEELALEIRKRIIEVTSSKGGHLASNLGIVELTLALHKVFNSPNDKFLWDVSHQSYVHKMLTGRNAGFEGLRQYKGLSGFTHPKESVHDHFHAGHAGTAISLALGMAKTRDLKGEDDYIIPIIGDATLTCGVSLEALNNISRDMKRLIVILNDNKMSISQNVGAITRILSRMINHPTTTRLYQELDTLVSKLPGCGTVLSKQGHKIAESIKNLVSPAAFFEQYGLSYIGPIDGHDVGAIIHALQGVKESTWPVILHVLTNKGQGMEEAIQNPVVWHGAKPFCIDTCKFHPTPINKPTFPKIFGQHILKMAERDPTLITVTPAMSAGSSLDELMKRYPERCIDVGIAESHAITYCGGIAHGGKMKVVASIYSTFLQRAFDNVFHDVCLQELPVVFAIDRAGVAGGDGQTHNGIYDISFLNAMPNMVIAQPRDGHVLKELLESAHSWKRPAAIRYPNLATEEPDSPLCYREMGKGEVLHQGKKMLIIALGHLSETAFQVSNILSTYGCDPTIMDPVFVKPLDTELLCRLLVDHTQVVTIEEHSLVSGMGAIINNFLMANGYTDISILNFGIPETFVEQGSHKELMNELGLSPAKIAERICREFQLSKTDAIECK